MNLTKKQIDLIRRLTPRELKGKSVSFYATLGYFIPSGANWSYRAGFIEYKKCFILVVTQFGSIV